MGYGQGYGKKKRSWKDKKKNNQGGGGDAEGDGKRQKKGDGDGEYPPPHVLESAAFESYYKECGVVPEAEWEAFITTLKKPLGTSFRITGHPSDPASVSLRAHMEARHISALGANLVLGGEAVPPPYPINWYPGRMAWRFDVSRSTLRGKGALKGDDSAAAQTLSAFHAFLMAETELGTVARQEEVSMVPPCLLDVRPGQVVIDMCAAPGSKTQQIIEAINPPVDAAAAAAGEAGGEAAAGDSAGAGAGSGAAGPSGLVIANDMDYRRCHLLVHQAKRLNSPALIVTNHDATMIPTRMAGDLQAGGSAAASTGASGAAAAAGAAGGGGGGGGGGVGSSLRFDRVLCDVPCSGDGTLRKAPDLWRRWSDGLGLGVHRMQLNILMRGLALLKPGGRLVYSTCSMNPIEDEAVVAAALLDEANQDFHLVDVSDSLPGLQRNPGTSSWSVRVGQQWHETYESLCSASGPDGNGAGASADGGGGGGGADGDGGGGGGDASGATEAAEAEAEAEEAAKAELATELTAAKAELAEAKSALVAAQAAFDAPTPTSEQLSAQDVLEAEISALRAATEEATARAEAAEARAAAAEATVEAAQAEADAAEADAAEADAAEADAAEADAAEAEASGAPSDAPQPKPSSQPKPRWPSSKEKSKYAPSMFAPPPEKATPLQLHRCMRVLPHMQDTGGFFIAVIERKTEEAHPQTDAAQPTPEPQPQSEPPAAAAGTAATAADGAPEAAASASAAPAAPAAALVSRIAQQQGCTPGAHVESALHCGPRNNGKYDALYSLSPQWHESMRNFFGLPPSFPSAQLVTRSVTGKAIFLVGDAVLRLLKADATAKYKLVNTGTRVLERIETSLPTPFGFRFAQEGIQFLAPHMTKQRLFASTPDLLMLLRRHRVQLSDFSSEALRQQILSTPCGAIAIIHDPHNTNTLKPGQPIPLVLAACRSGGDAPCLELNVKKAEALSILTRLGGGEGGEGGEGASASAV